MYISGLKSHSLTDQIKKRSLLTNDLLIGRNFLLKSFEIFVQITRD